MANGLLDPVYKILPSRVDAKRRSWDPTGSLGVTMFTPGHLTVTGRSLSLRRTRTMQLGHLTLTGRTASINKIRPISFIGHLLTNGKQLDKIGVAWATIPRFDINWGAVTYPYIVVTGVRTNYLIDPTGSVQTVTLGGIDLPQISYDAANDRIVVASNPGTDIVDAVYMVADGLASNTFEIALVNPVSYPIYPAENRTDWVSPNAFDDVPNLALHVGDYYGPVGPLVPADVGTLVLGPNGYMKATFIEFASGSPVPPQKVSSLRWPINAASSVVPISTITGLADGLYMTMVVSVINGVLTTAPDSQGWQLKGVVIPPVTTDLKLYIYGKVVQQPEASITIAHSAGKMMAMTTLWSSVNTANPFSVLPVMYAALYNDPAYPAMTTPSIVIPDAYTTTVSAIAHHNNPVFTNGVATYALDDQAFVSSTHWQGIAYKNRTTPLTTGLLTWGVTLAVGSRAGATFALRGVPPTITKYPFSVAMRHHNAVTGVNTFWTMPVNP